MTFTKSWKVYGRYGHRQRESFFPSYQMDFSEGKNIRVLEVINSDKTGTNDYTILRITRNTEAECDREFLAQICDGVFENSNTGEFEVIEY